VSPPPPGYAPPPPPGYAPPYGYPPPPPGYYYPPPRAAVVSGAPPGSRRKRGFLMLPYLGLHSYVNQEASAYGPGLRIGSLFGGRIGELFSINGELTLDRANVDSVVNIRQWFYRTSLSPLIHLPAGPVEVSLGPKLGIYSVSTNYSDTGATIESASSGYTTGLNAGVFAPLSPRTSIGGLLSFDLMWSNRTCAGSFGGTTQCGSTTDVGNVLGLTGGVLF
jgi:hypothetical protein